MSGTISLKIEFGGGLELLFSNQRSHRVTIPALVPAASSSSTSSSSTAQTAQDEAGAEKKKPADLAYLIFWLRDNLLKEREELFIENGTVRPGILVLVNDADWELEGEGEYQLKDGDEIVFISTLHGG
ncbi:ubiquitin-related modifier 1 [Cubamyces sp. BRFM 1775]|nr:ubiquitin-related modifier 1 [Cubamyces sp. BRFM 1775]